jgi:DnaJ family protein B protein 6
MLPSTDSPFANNGRRNGNRMQSFGSTTGIMFSGHGDGNGQWVSQSKVTRTINGVTESVFKRIDSNVSLMMTALLVR